MNILTSAMKTRRLLRFMRKPAPIILNPLAIPTASAQTINELLEISDGREYLEVGVKKGATFQCVKGSTCTGVDPNPLFDTAHLPSGFFFTTAPSDEYFAGLAPEKMFNIIFLDGLHTAEQTLRDLINALLNLSPNGAILIDDTVPCDQISAIPDYEESKRVRRAAGLKGSSWSGDVYRVLGWIARQPSLRWSTITNRGNPQTLVWNTGSSLVSLDHAEDALLKEPYEQLFGENTTIPSSFNPTTAEEALRLYAQFAHR